MKLNSVASQSPSKSIMPYVMRVLASADPQAYAEDLLEMCDFDTSEDVDSNDAPSVASLMRELWDDRSLDGLRTRYVITLWAAVCRRAWFDVGADNSETLRRLQITIRRCWPETAQPDQRESARISPPMDGANHDKCQPCQSHLERSRFHASLLSSQHV